jgi:hypothetical protein
MGSVQGVDHPAVSGVETDVARPPEDVTHTDVAERDLRELGRDLTGRPRDADADAGPGSIDEARTVEAGRPEAAPAVPVAHLRPREGDDGLAARCRCRLPACPSSGDERLGWEVS